MHKLLRPAGKCVGVVAVGCADDQTGQLLEGWQAWLENDEVGSSSTATSGSSRGLRSKAVATTAVATWVSNGAVWGVGCCKGWQA